MQPFIFFLFKYFFLLLQLIKIEQNNNWHDLTKVKINELAKNNIVFVDVTADWCITCQFNKLNVLNSKLIKNTFLKNNVVKVRGDWTKPNKVIEKYLNKYNRFGIPFNVLYNKDYPEGIILSELLQSSNIIEVIELMKKNE